jgi:hypothetical protein
MTTAALKTIKKVLVLVAVLWSASHSCLTIIERRRRQLPDANECGTPRMEGHADACHPPRGPEKERCRCTVSNSSENSTTSQEITDSART